ncbi:MAG: DUF2723 domain-containing protein [Caldilineaceae bacterium]|nr:DUF2723 domain-containing protein [Caldilineaceae bacterium]
MTNGVPHPPGYPFYTALLRLWLSAGQLLSPPIDIAWLGNVLSATCAALSVGVTLLAAGDLLYDQSRRWMWATCSALAWGFGPLLWGQALITEVYALHGLLFALLGWLTLGSRRRRWMIAPVVGLGLAHHPTFALLLPASFYYLLSARRPNQRIWRIAMLYGFGLLIAVLLQARTWLAASAVPTPPVNWGYADTGAGLWWLLSGAAYRQYLFAVPPANIVERLAAWAYTITVQLTPVGLAFALIGLADVDRRRHRLRNFTLIWIIPVSIYAMTYYTWDSAVYLLPVVWIACLLLGLGLEVSAAWLSTHWPTAPINLSAWLLVGTLVGVVALAAIRAPTVSLRADREAAQFVADARRQIEPGSIVISRADRETFGLWFAFWANEGLHPQAPNDTVLVNDALYQFAWYRRLLAAVYPDLPGIDESVEALVEENRATRTIFFTEPLEWIPAAALEADGPLWRLSK